MAEEPGFDLGTAGASGRREHERRQARREDDVRRRHPHLGSLLLKLQEPPEHERAWATGAQGEEELAAFLAKRCPGAIVLHDRRLPRSRANIDHLAVVPSGVHVIDAKRYKGRIEVRRPFFGEPRLFIAGRDKTKLVTALERQLETVRSALGPVAAEIPVRACFCFVNPAGQAGGSGIPLIRTLSIAGHPLLYPRRLAKRLNEPGELGPERMRELAGELARSFPPA